MADSLFRIKNGFFANGAMTGNSSGIFVGNTTLGNSFLLITAGGSVNSVVNSSGFFHNGVAIGGSGSAGGANTQVQFNDSAAFNGSAGLTFDKSTNIVFIANTLDIGANVVLATTGLGVGNSTVNSTHTSTIFQISNSTATANLTPTALNMGSLTVVNTTVVAVSGNTFINTTAITSANVISTSSTTDLLLATANTSAGFIKVKSDGTGIQGFGNSTVQCYAANASGFTIQKSRYQTVSFATTISWDCANGNLGTVTLTANATLTATNLQPGNYILHVLQDATGSRILTMSNTVFKFASGVQPSLSTAASAHDILSFTSDGTAMYGVVLPDMR